jgi:tripartite-type tricarboxylate transporter receptor subunit TctC
MKLTSLFACAALLCSVGAGRAEDPPFPRKGPIEITVLFPAGSSADVTARMLAEGVGRQLGASVVVVNRPGAGGAIGYRYVAGQKADGYSLVWNSNSISTTFHAGTLAFNYEAFAPVAKVLVESPVVAVLATSRWKTLGDLVAEAKAKPRTINVANSGTGSHTHISSVALFKGAGAEVVDVPFGAAQVVTSLLAGQVDAAVQLPAALSEHVKVGKVRFLAALIPQRDPAFPDVPTARESGFDVSLEAWRGIAVPKGTPQPVIDALEAAVKKTVESKEFIAGCERIGARPAYAGAKEFGQIIAAEDAELAKLMKLVGLKK